MSNLFPPHVSPTSVRPNSPTAAGSGSGRGRFDRQESPRSNSSKRGQQQQQQQQSPQRDRRNDDSYYDRRPPSRRDPDEELSPSRSYSSRYDNQLEDTFLNENQDWVRKSSRQRRFTHTTLPSLHTREQIARGEIDFDDSERDAVLGEMSDKMNDMSGFVQSIVQNKEETLKTMAQMFDEDGNPIPRYDEFGNPIPPEDEDGHALDGWDRHEEDTRKTKMVTIDTTKMSIKEGWLWKKGSGGGLFGRTNWTRRYFKFDMFQVVTIFYFKQQMPNVSEIRQGETKEQYQKRKKSFFNAQKQYARGYVKLMYAELNIPQPRAHRNLNINPNWVFEVVIPNSRAFFLCAESQEDFEKWTQTIGYITGTIQKARENPGPKPPRFQFDEAKRDAALCITAYGKGLFEAVAGHQSEFTVQGFDFRDGVPATHGGQTITAVMESRDLHYDLPVVDNQDGTYTITYTPTRVGTYELSIMLDDYDIKGSPFHPTVRPAPVSAPHCVGDGAGLFCAVVGAVNRFNIHTRNAFNQIVVARGVPFEVRVESPLVLCNMDGSPIANPGDWRPHDNGNGTYGVAYTVNPKPELLERLNRGEHFEGIIEVLLDDHIHTPSFPRSIKGAPFHPVLAASATGAALASAARHAALLLGPSEYNDFMTSFLVQSGQPQAPPMFDPIPEPRMSELRIPTGGVPVMMPSRAAPATTRPTVTIPRDEDDVEESSSFHVKESPIPPWRHQRAEPSSFMSTQMRQQQSFASDPSFQQQQIKYEYLPVQRNRPRSTPNSNLGPSSSSNALSPEQRESLDAEREALLTLRRELLEGKHMVDDQVNRMAYLERRNNTPRMGRTRQPENDVDPDGEEGIPPPPFQQRISKAAPAYTSHRSQPSYDQPPQRRPPTAPNASSPSSSAPVGSASLGQIGSFDSSVQALFQRHSAALKRVYRYYATRNSGGLESVYLSGFSKCLQDFGVKPTFASKKDVQDAFVQACRGDSTAGMNFPLFLEGLGYLAMIALSKPTFASLYPTTSKKIEVLLSLWGLGDQATFDGVLQKQRFMKGVS